MLRPGRGAVRVRGGWSASYSERCWAKTSLMSSFAANGSVGEPAQPQGDGGAYITTCRSVASEGTSRWCS